MVKIQKTPSGAVQFIVSVSLKSSDSLLFPINIIIMLIIAAYLSPFSIHETLIFLFPVKYRSPVKKIAVKAYSSIRKVFGSLLSLQKNTIQKYLDRINHNPYSSGRLQTGDLGLMSASLQKWETIFQKNCSICCRIMTSY